GEQAAAQKLWRKKQYWQHFAARLNASFRLNPSVRQLAQEQTIICRCENITLGQLQGLNHWRQGKLLSRCGMGACQGKICGPIAEQLLGWAAPGPRQPLLPVRLDTLAGE
ncbi:MAG: FAD/NAD(P)-binding oxidoreductase, partial [Enterobacteriaceae bacterium]